VRRSGIPTIISGTGCERSRARIWLFSSTQRRDDNPSGRIVVQDSDIHHFLHGERVCRLGNESEMNVAGTLPGLLTVSAVA
jgi:outer membrane lipoprotein SlyB